MKKLLFILLLLPVLAQAYPGLPNPPRPANTQMTQNQPPYFLYDGAGNIIGSTSPGGVDSYFATPSSSSSYVKEGSTSYTLPPASAGYQICYRNAVGVATPITVYTSTAGQYISKMGVNSVSGGQIASSGALGDTACFIGVSSTQWIMAGAAGTWTVPVTGCTGEPSPNAPTSLAASTVGASQIDLTWSESNTNGCAIASYDVFRGGTDIVTVTSPSFNDVGLTPSTMYTYTVKAKDSTGSVSVASSSVSATTGAAVGTLTPMSPATVTVSSGPNSIIVSGSNAYAVSSGTIDQFSTSTGALVPLSPATIGSGLNQIATNGSYLYATNGGSGINEYSVSGGLLTLMGTYNIVGASGLNDISISPNGLHAYVTDITSDYVYKLSISSGLLTQSGTYNTGVTPGGITVSPNSTNMYVTIIPYSEVLQFADITPLSTPSVSTGPDPQNVILDPTGSYAYVTNGGNATLSQYSVSGGYLTPLSPATVSTGAYPMGMVITPNGNNAYVANYTSGTVSQYSISAGKLTPLSPATVSVGSNPKSLAVSTDGHHLYVTNSGTNTISQFNIN